MSGLLRLSAAAIFLVVTASPGTALADDSAVPRTSSGTGIAVPGQLGPFLAKGAMLRSIPPRPSMRAASCGELAPTTLVIGVSEQPLTIRGDLSLARLRELSKQVQHRSAHATLGFYAGRVGLLPMEVEVLTGQPVGTGRGVTCPHLEIRSELVAVDRQIAVASDLRSSPCLLRAATAHYERHADTASQALHSFAADLSTTLGPEIDRYVRSRPSPPGPGDDQLRGVVEGLLTRSVARFTARMAVIQEAADTPDEVRSLAPFDDI